MPCSNDTKEVSELGLPLHPVGKSEHSRLREFMYFPKFSTSGTRLVSADSRKLFFLKQLIGMRQILGYRLSREAG